MPEPRCEGNVCTHTVQVLCRENLFSSEQAVARGEEPSLIKDVEIQIRSDQPGLCNSDICVETPPDQTLNEILTCPPQTKDNKLNPCYAYRGAFYALSSYLKFLNEKIDLDLQQVRYGLRRLPPSQILVHVNAPGVDNAFWSDTEEITCGDGSGRFPFCSDGDIPVHEMTHGVVDIINPLLTKSSIFGAGMAIHEGTADIGAACAHNDAQIGEDYNRLNHKEGYAGGLRSVNNTRTFKNTLPHTIEPHAVGLIYSGFWWSVARKIDTLLRSRQVPLPPKRNGNDVSELALRTMLALAYVTTGMYNTPDPTHADFEKAAIDAARACTDRGPQGEVVLRYIPAGKVGFDDLRKIIEQESIRYGFHTFAKDFGVTSSAPASAAGLAFDPSRAMAITSFGKQRAMMIPQLYQSSAHGDLPVIGRGKVVREGKEYLQGVAALPAGALLKEEQGLETPGKKVMAQEALARARQELQSVLPGKLAAMLKARRTDDTTIQGLADESPAAIQKIVDQMLIDLARGQATLAVLPERMELVNEGGKVGARTYPAKFVWFVQTASVDIAIDAVRSQDGSIGVASLIVRKIID